MVSRYAVAACIWFTALFVLALVFGVVTISVHHLEAQTKIAPAQIKSGTTFTALACIAPGTANSNCAGLVYIDAVTAAGTEVKIVGVPPDSTFVLDPAKWSIVP